MPQLKQTIEYGQYYHIYNRGNNRNDIFFETDNYNHFLRLYDKYIDPIAETYAWCLLKNHFHFLVRIKDKEEVAKITLKKGNLDNPRILNPSRQFGHLFNAYTQAINKRYKRTGSLFESTFERKLVDSEKYFQKLIFYIHNNPVHHGLVDSMIEYPWSSYLTVTSTKETKLNRGEVIKVYGDLENFKYYHSQMQHFNQIESIIIE
ncbi:transposase [Flavobacterium terrae]|uniref:REP element-mobilizing transposase RayT n=1 Tax=Flavobacterium terrae TaxID=415425 RepID=A0A1M6F1S4_9FLAO|nr:transposase [Flavobacterium terrae]SHI91668.1 REP element-mobilizing transposase RayT [Flavobacterium terrae]